MRVGYFDKTSGKGLSNVKNRLSRRKIIILKRGKGFWFWFLKEDTKGRFSYKLLLLNLLNRLHYATDSIKITVKCIIFTHVLCVHITVYVGVDTFPIQLISSSTPPLKILHTRIKCWSSNEKIRTVRNSNRSNLLSYFLIVPSSSIVPVTLSLFHSLSFS